LILYGESDEVARWVAARIPHMQGGDFGPCVGVGVVRGNRLAAGVVWHDYQPALGTMQASVSADDPRWAYPATLREIFRYPFGQLGLRKIWAILPHTNDRALRFVLGVGFVREAVLSEQIGPRLHAVIAGMKRGAWSRRYGG
jgi:RimJ/RimL family protein N-acetyltransferase